MPTLPPYSNPTHYLQYHCLPHSTGISPSSHVTIAVRSLHCHTLSPSTTSTTSTVSDELSHRYGTHYRILITLSSSSSPDQPLHTTPVSTVSSSLLRRTVAPDLPLRRPAVDCRWECTWDPPTDSTKTATTVLELPVRYKDIARDAVFHLRVLETRGERGCDYGRDRGRDRDGVVGSAVDVGGVDLPLWDDKGLLKTGLHKVPLFWNHHHRGGGGGGGGPPPPPTEAEGGEHDEKWEATQILDELSRMKSPRSVPSPPAPDDDGTRMEVGGGESYPSPRSVPWLDAVTESYCHSILAEERDERGGSVGGGGGGRGSGTATAADVSLVVELPACDYPIVYQEIPYTPPAHGASGSVTALDLARHHHLHPPPSSPSHSSDTAYTLPMPTPRPTGREDAGLTAVQILDPEDVEDDPVEDKYRTLRHELLRGMVDPQLKPDRGERGRLEEVIGGTSQHLTTEEKDLLWRFRFSLVDNRRALTKFLLAVEWTVESEVVQAAELLEQWRERSPIEVTDALKLLGKNVAFQTGLVRSYAVDTLAAAPDGELVLYLLPLVQALKYETLTSDDDAVTETRNKSTGSISPRRTSNASAGGGGRGSSSLGWFLVERAVKNIELANYLYWYLKVELDDPVHGPRYRDVFRLFEGRASKTFAGGGAAASPAPSSLLPDDPFPSAEPSTLRSTSKLSSSHAHQLALSKKQRRPQVSPPSLWSVLTAQDKFISTVMNHQCEARMFRGKKDGKEAHLREVFGKGGLGKIEGGRFGVPLPSAPDVTVTGVKAESAVLFKSALYPALIEFYVEEEKEEESGGDGRKDSGGSTVVDPSSGGGAPSTDGDAVAAEAPSRPPVYKVIVKTGDDLRQDQLVIMLIKLMDRILKRGTLDLCLKPYPIMATSHTTGLVEFVEGSRPVSQVLNSHNNSILQYFQSVAPCPEARYGVDPEVMQRYIRSCAGYCVITYLLGVGDRHLDNIMLQPSGHFFHIDFGYIFGNDPKISVTGFRLTREMTDGMGGQDSSEYRQFCSLACQTFNLLRKSAGLVLNLLHLMSDAGIEHLSNNSDAVIAKVEERFRLELTDERAETYFLGLIDESLAALAPRVMEFFHQIAVQRR